eukprot:1502347-Rhodomonas_salina.2
MSGGAEEKPSVQEEQDTPPQTTEAAAASWDKYADEVRSAVPAWETPVADRVDAAQSGMGWRVRRVSGGRILPRKSTRCCR